ncbi:MAG TPA: ATP-binding protein [Thermodesulfobacteriota bacterium]|nr:ATP-binding protein [Deltaproteobacteria bacterium]HNR14059.1 ATP-binding protein [Thermodesulfobacteriota bacterium]HNU71508.1 ATP-binding protein [Thermodesulfobacteriota bacterium]
MQELNKTTPGIHNNFSLGLYSADEQKIIHQISSEWYVTSSGPGSGPTIQLGKSVYRFFIMKPTKVYSEMFNLEREIIAVFSPYDRFEPRTLDAFSAARSKVQELRLESVCYCLISKDVQIESTIENLLKSDPEQPVVVPFHYHELESSFDSYFMRNRFRKHFYSRDLFAFMSPLKKDIYFFGRTALVHDMVNRHRSGEHTGLFGLRKSGKTSIIYAVERLLQLNNEHYVSIDCESPSIHKLSWSELLHKTVVQFKEAKESSVKISDSSAYNEKEAADRFSDDMLKVYESKKRNPTLLIFDEIERISPRTGSSEHWRNGDDFVYFWQTLRGFFQRNPHVITYMIAGTNPSCIEQALINHHENPLFSSIPCQYVPAFTLDQVRDMSKKLGRYMGIKFDELIYAKMTDDFGGHPFLIRQLCSSIHKLSMCDRPVTVDKALYEKARTAFIQNSSDYLDMIVQVLREWYPDEYDMLTLLANGDVATFEGFAKDHVQYTQHLVGYGLIQNGPNGYSFNIESIRDFVSHKHKYERLNLTYEEMLQEITVRRNKIERNLRVLTRNTLKQAYGKKAEEKLLLSLPGARRSALQSETIERLLDKGSSPLYFLDLRNTIEREWAHFQNIFETDKSKLLFILDEINAYGRPDAHGKDLSKDDFTQMRLHFKCIEGILERWGL